MIAHGKEIKVFTANANVPFAKGICAELGLDLGDSTVTAFADGEVSVSINESVRGCDVFVVQSTCKPVNNNLMLSLIHICQPCVVGAASSTSRGTPANFRPLCRPHALPNLTVAALSERLWQLQVLGQ